MWIVKHCFNDYGEIWKNRISEHETEKGADDAADDLKKSVPFWDWVEVEEE